MPYFHFRCFARATFDRDLFHSADACFLVMAFELACVGYLRAQLKTLSSLLKETRVQDAKYACAGPYLRVQVKFHLALEFPTFLILLFCSLYIEQDVSNK